MTLDEAIIHARDKAEESREYIVDDCNLEPFEAHCNSQCIKCAEEHEQLAEWLEELKELREIKEEYQKGMDNSYATFMYNKAIDDFEDEILKHLNCDDYGNAMGILAIADKLKKEGAKINRKIPMNGVIKCRTDKLGRISIPAPYRRELGIEPQEEVSMVLTGEGMYVFKETEEEILERKCNEVMSAAFTCKDMNVEEREKLGELLVKLIGESAEC